MDEIQLFYNNIVNIFFDTAVLTESPVDCDGVHILLCGQSSECLELLTNTS